LVTSKLARTLSQVLLPADVATWASGLNAQATTFSWRCACDADSGVVRFRDRRRSSDAGLDFWRRNPRNARLIGTQ